MIKALGILSSIFREAARRPRSTGVTGNPVSLLERPAARRPRRPLVWGRSWSSGYDFSSRSTRCESAPRKA